MSDKALDAWIEAFPAAAGVPFRLRPRGPGVVDGLYTVAALYDRLNPAEPTSWRLTYDHAAYAWFIDRASGKPRPLHIAEAIAARIHDANIGAAIDAHLLRGQTKTVGFMGGHDNARSDPAYRQIAVMARTLRRKGLQIVTGGGPGLMEAANFGAFLAPYDDDALDRCLETLMAAEFHADWAGWLRTACQARAQLLGDWKARPLVGSRNLGIPTWHYGNEPPNLFATAIGKYFYNSVREDGLVAVASGGLVFGPGAAGTVQEIFQDVTLNYYRPPGTCPTPMVFIGKDFWDPDAHDAEVAAPDPRRKPAYPLVRKMGADGGFSDALLLCDDVDEMARFLEDANLAADGAVTLAEARLSARAAARADAAG
jgi:predicted Rossmann-fold nucleotide-binding protein